MMKRLMKGIALVAALLVLLYAGQVSAWYPITKVHTLEKDSASTPPTTTTYWYLTPESGVSVDMSEGFGFWVSCTDSGGEADYNVLDTFKLVLQSRLPQLAGSDVKWVDDWTSDTLVMDGTGAGASGTQRLTYALYRTFSDAYCDSAQMNWTLKRLILKGIAAYPADSATADDYAWKAGFVQGKKP